MAKHHEVTGLILAGGRATRMGGVDKGLVCFQGRTLVEHVILRLQPQVGPIIINANRSLDEYQRFGLSIVTDGPALSTEFVGPLAGLLAGMRAAITPWILAVPCDAPFVPADLAARLLAARGETGAVARTRDGMQPVFCLLSTSLAPDLARALDQGSRKTERWLRDIGAAEVPFEDARAFANFNALDDLRNDGSSQSH